MRINPKDAAPLLFPRFETKKIDPAEAERLLATSDNRPERGNKIYQMAKDMAAGLFLSDNGETIKLSPSGKLLDGHHRLKAVIKSGKTIEFTVAYDVQDDRAKTIDTGTSRSLGDTLAMEYGVTAFARNIQSAVHALYAMVKGGNYSAISRTVEVDFYKAHLGLVDCVRKVSKLRRAKVLIRPAVAASLMYVLRGVNPETTDLLFSAVNGDVHLGAGHPFQLLWEALQNARNRNQRSSERTQAAVVIKAFNMMHGGFQYKLLGFREGEVFPQIIGLEGANLYPPSRRDAATPEASKA